ncbi:MAG: hypothetical protein AAB803_00745 [Patescibacteria group bacterium]
MNGFLSSLKLRFKRWDRRLTITKRQQFVAITLALTAGLILTQLASSDFRYPLVTALSLATYGMSAFAMRQDLRGIEWVTLLTLPTLFTGAVGLFYFLLPVRWLTRVPVAVLYAVGMYALLLTENIYNVAANRTIALLRAAYSVGFLLTIVTYFLLVQTLLAFRLPVIVIVLLVGAVSFVLLFQSLWAMELGERGSSIVVRLSASLTLVLMELAWVFSFWPAKTTLQAIFFTTCFYGLAGMAQQYLVEKLYKKTVTEFFIVCVIVLGLILLTTRWRGNL